MTPAARVKAAIEALVEIERGDRPADVVLEHFFKSRRYMGAKDRRAVAGNVYDVMRRRSRIDWWLERFSLPASARHRLIASLLLGGESRGDQLPALFTGACHCPEPLTDEEAELGRALAGKSASSPDQPDWVRLEYPRFLDQPLRDSLGGRLAAEIEALNQPAPPDIRVNVLRASRTEAREALAAEGISAMPTPYSPWGLRIDGRTRLGHVDAFRRGWIEVQDEGSQLIALMVEAKPGMTVVDLCAGAGGKTLALAAAMDNRGRLKACDVSANRLQRMEGRLRRAGVTCAQPLPIPEIDDGWTARLAGAADRVLVDAPCTGTGTWRRQPDAKWRLGEAEVGRLVAAQRRIIETAARLVAPGGRLVYATCSVLRAEDEDQVEEFLNGHPDFRLVPAETVWPQVAHGACPTAGMLRLSPATTATDAFFVAVLERT